MKVINIWGISSGFVKLGTIFLLLLLISGCTSSQQPNHSISEPKLYQSWQLKLGDQIAGSTVIGGLGDISIALNGKSVYAPSTGNVYLGQRGCVYFAGTDTPAYLFRLCGLKSPKLGALKAGDAIATGDILQFATLLKQSDGTWALVEPDKSLLERTLKPR
ncbi:MULTISPECIES: hypothetical protein [Leptolyngbya]|jgi:hypothetical protein|uniref:Lipoprotein n=1 Tax=Leptolyngbya boryana NIES-2135 TaxID=1973484 RepID=A0A1Z4JHC7_LEPBY|nr:MULTISPECIES: hypothetical protein [Leptolyngbya]BAY56172.1 hypothetical protein NIES2135_30020 [Leptolyngbya boryana NIES-2135]MBD1855926.1 hypothetical protein [Leptolyngbya sp. FACHB-1624]MBD2366281.1 hypothetical protein [Leptolyngbya sp. FACHB-161]MBD2372461.1 hypothetical protein [Leptolyngbya sp. FACHB-238]MBD2396884.1 hypothetical protein [Leptolyngbya sp. FACHB-239]